MSGQSSGAISAHHHYYYNQRNTNNIILASGTAFFRDIIQESDKTLPVQIAQPGGLNIVYLDTAI